MLRLSGADQVRARLGGLELTLDRTYLEALIAELAVCSAALGSTRARATLGKLIEELKACEGPIKADRRVIKTVVEAACRGHIVDVRCAGHSLVLDDVIKISATNEGLVYELPDNVRLLFNDSYSYFYTVYETWILGIQFLGPNIRDWLVIDVGSFIGDTPLYYASRGAYVVALEPILTHFNLMLNNVRLNRQLVGNRILPINAALGGVDGFLDFWATSEIDGEASAYGGEAKGLKVKARSFTLTSLLSFLKEEGINIGSFRALALKLDCKGCEYDVVNDKSIGLFDLLKIEYSGYLRNKTLDDLVNKLKDLGFDCEVFRHNPYMNVSLRYHGTLRCVKHSDHYP